MNAATILNTNPDTAKWGRRDWRNLGLIVTGFGIAMLLMPINHNFPITDDWSWYRATEQVVNGHGFSPPDFSCATLVSHVYLGAVYAWLFGLSFTSLTAATMTLSLVGAISFYLLLRQLHFSPNLSGLGTAVLVFNPVYLSLSYSYMTDVTFVAMMLLGCLFYVKGLSGQGQLWLWLGSVSAALGFLDRQFGLVLPIAAALWLLYAGRLRWRSLLAVALIPMLVGLAYFLWRSGFGPTFGDAYCSKGGLLGFVQDPGGEFLSRGFELVLALPLFGLTIPLLGKVPRFTLAIFWLAIVGLAAYYLHLLSPPAGTYASADVEINAGNFNLSSTPIWWLGIVLVAWLLANLSELAWRWLISIRSRRSASIDFLYLVAFILFIGTFAINQAFYLRYLLPVLPFLIIAALTTLRDSRQRILILTWMAMALVASYSIVLHLDDYDYYATRWQAGQYLLHQGIALDKIDDGLAWDGFYLYDETRRRLDTTKLGDDGFPPYTIIDRQYIVAIRQQPGYSVIQRFPYFTRLFGFTNRYLLVQQRNSP